MKVYCPAKINLFLNVIGYNEVNNMHYLKMINQTIDLYDEMDISIDGVDINVSTDIFIPFESNSVYRACLEFFSYTNIRSGIKIDLKKRIPLESGLGGESTDAAGVLLGLDRIFKTNLSKKELCFIGSRIGSDVPFFIHSGCLMIGGCGDKILDSVNNPYDSYIIIVPNFGLSTKEMFKKIDNIYLSELDNNIWNYNDFMSVVPDEILALRDYLNSLNISNHSLTGSGSAYYIVNNDISFDVIGMIRDRYPNYRIIYARNVDGFIFKDNKNNKVLKRCI